METSLKNSALVHFGVRCSGEASEQAITVLLFRVEAFNVFNHAQFNGPTAVDGDIGSSTFGNVVSAAPPRILQGALKFSF